MLLTERTTKLNTPEYKTAYATYRELIESGEQATMIYKGIIAYRNNRIHNAHDLPLLESVLKQRLYNLQDKADGQYAM